MAIPRQRRQKLATTLRLQTQVQVVTSNKSRESEVDPQGIVRKYFLVKGFDCFEEIGLIKTLEHRGSAFDKLINHVLSIFYNSIEIQLKSNFNRMIYL